MRIDEFFQNLMNGARWDVGVSINRSNALPLDANSVFSSLESAQNYAAGRPDDGILNNAYPGQVLAVVTEQDTTIYYIDGNMELKSIGNMTEVMDYIGEIPEGSTAKTIVEYINEKAGCVIETIRVNGVEQTIINKEVDISVPTKASDLTNDIGYLTEHQDISGKADKSDTLAGYGITDAYTSEEVDDAIQGAKDYAKGLVDAMPAQTDYTLSIEEDTSDTSVAKRYIFKQHGEEVGRIDLAKELVVTSGSVKEVTENGVPYDGAIVCEKYIELVIANQDTPIYIPTKDLVDVYTAEENAAEIQLEINNQNQISATIVSGSIIEEKLSEIVRSKLDKVWEEAGSAQTMMEALLDGPIADHAKTIDNLVDVVDEMRDEKKGILAASIEYTEMLDALMSERVEKLEKDTHIHDNKELLDTYTQTNDDLAAAVVKMHAHNNGILLDGITSEKVAAWDAAERNVISTVDETQFAVTDRKLTLLDIAQDKISGFTNAAGAEITLAEVLSGKVDKHGTDRLITLEEAKKLELLVIDPESGQAAISGTVNANQVQGLSELLEEKVDKVDGMGLSANNFTDTLLNKLNSIESNAQVNKLEGITFNGQIVPVDENKIANIVYSIATANQETIGGVKSSEETNKVSVATDGTMEVNSVNVNKLVQDEGEYLVLNGGTSAL